LDTRRHGTNGRVGEVGEQAVQPVWVRPAAGIDEHDDLGGGCSPACVAGGGRAARQVVSHHGEGADYRRSRPVVNDQHLGRDLTEPIDGGGQIGRLVFHRNDDRAGPGSRMRARPRPGLGHAGVDQPAGQGPGRR
jgi:hypothetical protein